MNPTAGVFAKRRAAPAGVTSDMIRFYVGTEHIDDFLNDLEECLPPNLLDSAISWL